MRQALLSLNPAYRNARQAAQAVVGWISRQFDPPVDPTGANPSGGYEDPRCEGKRQAAAWGAMWSDLCRGEDGRLVDLKECHRRMTDGVYARTGGRCWQEPNPADGNNRIVCREDSARGQNPGSTPGGTNPSFTDPTPWNRPNRRSAGIGPVPSPVQPFLDNLCIKDGRCPGPMPFNNGAAAGTPTAMRAGPTPCRPDRRRMAAREKPTGADRRAPDRRCRS